MLEQASITVQVTADVEERAKYLSLYGIKPLDALHLASAEKGEADYFCTCDDRLMRQARRVPGLAVRVVTPVEFIQELEKWL